MDKSNTGDFAERTADMMESTKRFRESESNTDFENKVEQLIGWAKSGKNAGYYLMDIENVDSLKSDILLAHNQSLEAAVRAAVLQELADLKLLEDLRGSELPRGTIADRIAELQALPTPDSGSDTTPDLTQLGNVSGERTGEGEI